MIYTVTFNPAIDYVIALDDFRLGSINRTTKEDYNFGGKGINVSIILKNLGIDSVALGFISGFTGTALRHGLEAEGLKTDFIELANGFTRINVKIRGENETEINGQGPNIDAEAVERLFEKLDGLTGDDMLIVSGSVPATMPEDIYERILARMAEKDITVTVDATGKLLMNVLQYHPFLIKPNDKELAEMLGRPMETTEDIIQGAKDLRELGARNVLISRGAKGACLVTEDDETMTIDAIKGDVVNTVGAGDSMVAGFIAGYIKTGDYKYALRLGNAAGAATACSTGLATREDIEGKLNQ